MTRADGCLRIGELAEHADVSVETIRYYERRGLLREPRRSASGYRQYGHDAVDRLRFVRRAQRLGFSLREIGELLQLWAQRSDQCGDVREQIEAKLRDLESRLQDLRRMRAELERLREECARADPSGRCPTLEDLASTPAGSSR